METYASESDTRLKLAELAARWTAAQPVVAAFVASVIPRHHDAEDVLQRTAAALVANADKYDPAQPFVNWAIGVARIEALRLKQERNREQTTFDTETVEAIAGAFEREKPDLDELRVVLDGCISRLRGRVRDIFELHYVQELRPSEVAAKIGRSTNSIFVALHRGRASLRRCMERRMGLTGGAS